MVSCHCGVGTPSFLETGQKEDHQVYIHPRRVQRYQREQLEQVRYYSH
jgi:hypothetical protein